MTMALSVALVALAGGSRQLQAAAFAVDGSGVDNGDQILPSLSSFSSSPSMAISSLPASANHTACKACQDGAHQNCHRVYDLCQCTTPHVLTCKVASAVQMDELIVALTAVPSTEFQLQMVDLSLKNVTVIREDVFGKWWTGGGGEGTPSLPPPNTSRTSWTLKGLSISSEGKVNQVEDGAFVGLRGSLLNLGLPYNDLGPDIPREILHLPLLSRLDLSKNSIQRIGPQLKAYARSLAYLDISFNRLSTINGDEGGHRRSLLPSNLTTLKAQHNDVTMEGLSGADLAALVHLDLSYNNITGNLTSSTFHCAATTSGGTPRGGSSSGAQQLRTLRLEHNHIGFVDAYAFRDLPELATLWLSRNEIQLLDEQAFGGGADSLSYIDLSHNSILEVGSGVFAPIAGVLRHLDLSHNRIVVLDTGLTAGPLVHLEYLDLQNNDIIKIDEGSLELCRSLRTLLLTGG